MCRDCGCSSQPEDHSDVLLARNDHQAQHNRHHFDHSHTLCINLMGAPGCGKTRMLERMAPELEGLLVVEGDLSGELDAQRMRRVGIPAIQIQTGQACHLDAHMVHEALHQLDDTPRLLIVENVGNLACPADFDLGEHLRVVAVSVTEGDTKPEKYPAIFAGADAVVLTKLDLLPHVRFSVESFWHRVKALNPSAHTFEIGADQDIALLATWIKNNIT